VCDVCNESLGKEWRGDVVEEEIVMQSKHSREAREDSIDRKMSRIHSIIWNDFNDNALRREEYCIH
jgi:hypothetical protein